MSYLLCGCYYHIASSDHWVRSQRHYLPLIESEVHSTILSTTSRTVLKQTFTNPSSTDPITECRYTFPLYDGVSVVSFTCRIGKKVLHGLVKEKAKAKEIFDQAVAKGETAGLLEQAPEASDVFSTKLGNIPAGESVIVEITYIGELKHHETDGIRFTIPTRIAPRYGDGPSHGFSTPGLFSIGGNEGGIKIVVNVNMPDGSFIKGVQSPSHPIAVSMGTVSTASNDQPSMSKASATLSLGSAALEKDFVLIVQSKDVGIPKAILETHPTIPNHRALMATLVPKFSLPASRSEIVFVADRSGSMAGNIDMLVSAMKVFLKSLPQGVKFNICSFGSRHSFLWDKSQTNSRETLTNATNHLSTFSANMGGTETFGAIQATIETRLTDLPLEIILLTDGDIHRQNDLFEYVNQKVEKTKGNIRVFPLGIGNGVSHALIEGLARAGNGFAQAVQLGERLDNAVVRMLRGALSPHITDYTLEVKYEQENGDFELVDRVTESLKVLLTDDTQSLKSPPTSPKPAISLFNPATEPEKDAMKDLQETTFFIPAISTPKLLQAPHKIPSLFSFSRTTVYLLMSPETIQRKPITVVLRGTSEHGPLALEIPIEALSSPAETIHQLAAKKAVQDLEEGRGWIYDAKDQAGVLVKDKYPSSFEDIAKREAVRLGEKFQIAGNWCSFVAVAANDKEIAEKKQRAAESSMPDFDDNFELPDMEYEDDSYDMVPQASYMPVTSTYVAQAASQAHSRWGPPVTSGLPFVGECFARRSMPAPTGGSSAMGSFGQASAASSASSGFFGNSSSIPPPPAPDLSNGPPIQFGASSPTPPPPPPAYHQLYRQQDEAPSRLAGRLPSSDSESLSVNQSHGGASPASSRSGIKDGTFDSSSNSYQQDLQMGPGQVELQQERQQSMMARQRQVIQLQMSAAIQPNQDRQDRFVQPNANPVYRRSPRSRHTADSDSTASKKKLFGGGGLFGSKKANHEVFSSHSFTPEAANFEIDWATKPTVEKVLALIDLQDFEGWWPAGDADTAKILRVEIEQQGREEDMKIWATLLVIKFLEVKCAEEEGTWELVVEKARSWLAGLGKMDLDEFEKKAEEAVKAN